MRIIEDFKGRKIEPGDKVVGNCDVTGFFKGIVIEEGGDLFIKTKENIFPLASILAGFDEKGEPYEKEKKGTIYQSFNIAIEEEKNASKD